MSESTLRRSEHGTLQKQHHNKNPQDFLDDLQKRMEALYDQLMKLEVHEDDSQKEAITGIKKDAQSIKETLVYHQDETKPLGYSTPTTNSSEETRLKNELEASQIKNSDLQDQINCLEKRVIELEKKVIELKEEKKKLEIGQVAFDFEKAMAIYILPEHKQIGGVDVYNRTKAWVKKEKKKNTEEGKDANEKLLYIMTKWQLSNEHDKLIKMLKNERKGPAHPSILHKDLQIPEYLNEAQKKCFKDIIEIIEFVKKEKEIETP